VQLVVFFFVPAYGMIDSGTPVELIPYVLLLAGMTLGLIFVLYTLVVSVCCMIIDRKGRIFHMIVTGIMSAWVLWALISWSYIEYMDYLL